jgi:hypothetical protein
MRLLGLALLLVCCGAAGQTISPVITECGLKCSGEFKVTNNSVKPTIVVLNTFSFKVVDNKPVQLPLDTGTKVELDATSTRLSPLSDHVFSYKILCDQEPCMTQIIAGFPAGKTKDGSLVMIRLPHSIYSCKKQKDCRKRALNK